VSRYGRCDVSSPRLRAILTVAIILLASYGCGDPDGRRAISGVVTLDDRPLDSGMILFEPAPGDPAGTSVGSKIRDGRFSIPRGQGPMPGSYMVRIYAASGKQSAPGPGQPGGASRPLVDRIPEQYNRTTILREEIAPGTSRSFRFDLQSEVPARDVHRRLEAVPRG